MSDTVLNKGQYLHCSKISTLTLVITLQGFIYDFFMLSVSSIAEIHKSQLLNTNVALGEKYQFTFIQIPLLAG